MNGNHEEDEFVAVRVQDPRVQNEGSWNSYVDYKIFLHTNSKAFTAKTSCVRRRYSEFVWLKKKLQKNAGLVPVPDLPGKSFFSFSSENFLERRRKGLQTFLDKVVSTTVCLSDSQLHLFLQTQLPVGHIQDCVQGHTPYSVTDAILTYATSNRGLVQAQDDDSIKEPSLTVSYESMESPAPHQPCLETKQPCSPARHSGCDPADGLMELHHNSKAHEKSSVRISERKNHLEAIVECVSGPSATFFLGDEQDDEDSLVPAGDTRQTSRRVQTPVDVHSPMGRGFSEDSVFKECEEEREEDEDVASSDTQVRTDPAAQSELEKTDVCEDANTDVLHVNDCKEQFIGRDVRSHEEEGLRSESQVLDNHITSEVELVDVDCLNEPEVQQTHEEEADNSHEDGRSLPSSNDSIVKVSDEESVCDDTDDSIQADPEEATSRHILDLHMRDAASPKAEDGQSVTSVDVNSAVDGGDLTESSDFSVLESSSSCVPGLTGDKRTESDSLLSLDAAESPLRRPETRCIS